MNADIQTVIMWIILIAAVVATVSYVLKRIRGGKSGCDCGCCNGCPAKKECGDAKRKC